MLNDILVVAGISTSLLLVAVLLWSAVFPDRRFWPPGRADWRVYAYFGLSAVSVVALVALGYTDWNSWMLPRPGSLVVGVPVLVGGLAGFFFAASDLGMEETSGMEGELQTEGFYRFSRNPQLVFLLIALLGGILTTNSGEFFSVAIAVAFRIVSMPYAEEPWLRDRYGDAYEEYIKKVERFW